MLRRPPTKPEPAFDLQSIVKFEADREHLKKYIQANFRDSEMLDYEKETRDLVDTAHLSDKEIDRQFAEVSQRPWRFLSENVIFRDTNHLNKHQQLIKEKAKINHQNKMMKKVLKEQLAREEYKN